MTFDAPCENFLSWITGLIGNGFCNAELDIVECNYDGGDCCGLCQTIIVTLEGRVTQDITFP